MYGLYDHIFKNTYHKIYYFLIKIILILWLMKCLTDFSLLLINGFIKNTYIKHVLKIIFIRLVKIRNCSFIEIKEEY